MNNSCNLFDNSLSPVFPQPMTIQDVSNTLSPGNCRGKQASELEWKSIRSSSLNIAISLRNVVELYSGCLIIFSIPKYVNPREDFGKCSSVTNAIISSRW